MLGEAARHLNGATSIEKVYFVLFDAEALGVFQEAMREVQAKGKTTR